MKKFIVMFVVLLPSIALAQLNNNYFGITVGAVFPQDFESDNEIPGSTANLHDVDTTTGAMTGIRIGHIFEASGNILAMEIEGHTIGGVDIDNEYYYTASIGADVDFDADIATRSIMLNILVRKPDGATRPYIGLGAGWVWFELEDAALIVEPGYIWLSTGTRYKEIGDVDDDTFAYQALAGVDFDLTERAILNIGARYFYVEPELKKGTDFEIDGTFKTFMFTVGLTFPF